jgi:ribosome biogenesis GTPase
MEGLIKKSTGKLYLIRCNDGSIVNCTIKGAFRLKGSVATNPLAVGDRIEFDYEENDKVGVIKTLLERKNYIIRKSINLSRKSQIIAANIDMAFLVVSLFNPCTSTGFIDRFLVTAEAYRIPITIVFNKRDIYNKGAIEILNETMQLYKDIGYDCISISAYNPDDVNKIKALMNHRVNLFSGQSGVGKTTLLNAINPLLNQKTASISKAHSKGVHTTTFAELFEIENGTFILDTPGIRDFGMYDFKKEEVSHYFPEMLKILNGCRFNNCLHINEPDCAVKKAVEEGIISQSRYYNYLSILNGEDIYK